MNSKELRKYTLIVEIGNCAPTYEGIIKLFDELARNDFQTAIDMWEFTMTTYAPQLSKLEVSQLLETRVWEVFSSVSDARLKTNLGNNPQLLKLIYSSVTAATAGNLAYITHLVMGGKIDAAGEILKLISLNKTPDYNTRMQAIVDDVFVAGCKKSGTTVPSLNRKQTMLLLEYALKMKGPQKNIMSQRIKELA
ncbi:MAG: hypothetical protein FWE31_00295 [Firmicutes bacterium]|nr:hypothetical protein [Bacillota bacterium]